MTSTTRIRTTGFQESLQMTSWRRISFTSSFKTKSECRCNRIKEIIPHRFSGTISTLRNLKNAQNGLNNSAVYWRNIDNQRNLFVEIGNQLGIRNWEDWYNITGAQIKSKLPSILWRKYDQSLLKALRSVFPQHDWKEWKFAFHAKTLRSPAILKELVGSIGLKLGIQKNDDWYKVKKEDIIKISGTKILNKFGWSLFNILKTCYPEHEWLGWKFHNQPRGFWKDPANQKFFLEWFSQKNQLKSLDDWYRVTYSQVVQEGGSSLLLKHGCLINLLRSIYPEHNWQPWKFRWAPRFFWNDISNIHLFVQDLSEKLHIVNLDDWYRVSVEQLDMLGARNIVMRFGGLGPFLSVVYPHYQWDVQKFMSLSKKATQRWLKLAIQQVFPDIEIHEDYIPQFKSSPSSRVEFDLFIPSLNLAIEYQGKQHYHHVKHFAPTSRYQCRDSIKRNLCEQNEITLVEVPYWWDRKPATVAKLLQEARPELQLAVETQPFPSQITAKESFSAFMLPMQWNGTSDIKGWWMSEKLEGIRVRWNPDTHTFVTSQDKPISAAGLVLPSESLDGILHSPKGYVYLCKALSQVQSAEAAWPPQVHFWVTDVPLTQTSIEQRLEHLKEIIENHHDCKLVPWIKCEGKKHLTQFAEDVAEKYNVYDATCKTPVKNRLAKTVWLMKSGCSYKPGKTSDLLKVPIDSL